MKKTNCLIYLSIMTATVFAQNKSALYENYIEKYNELAIVEQARHGIPASITLAQALLESSAGKSELSISSNNHFGIKCHANWEGERIYHDDDKKGECFRKYNKVIDSYEDHSLFLKRDRYKLLYTYDITDYKSWANGLKAAGYATDPSYANKLITIIEDYELFRFDNPKQAKLIAKSYQDETKKQEKSIKEKGTTETGNTSEIKFDARNMYSIHEVFKTNNVKYVTATANDNLQSIADEFDLTERELLRFNEFPKGTKITAGTKVFIQAKKSKSVGKAYRHIVTYGESMHSISQEYGVKMSKIYKMNNLEKWSPVQVGMKLKLR